MFIGKDTLTKLALLEKEVSHVIGTFKGHKSKNELGQEISDLEWVRIMLEKVRLGLKK